jgi:hypothetical protein
VAIQVQTVTLATQTRDGWNGWGDDGSCRIWKTLHASATREGTMTITNARVTGDPCIETITGNLDLDASFTIGPAGDHYHCSGVTGSVTLEVNGTAQDGDACVGISESSPQTLSCADFSAYALSAPLSAHPEATDGISGAAVGWPQGCTSRVVSADWPYPFWRAGFLFGDTFAISAEHDYDGDGAHFVLTGGDTTAESGEYTMDVSTTTHPADRITVEIDDHGSVQISLSDEWKVSDLLDAVSTAGSDGFTDTSGPAVSSLSADSITATYQAARYRFQRAANAATVTYVEVTEKWSPDTGGTLVETTTSPTGTLNIPAQVGETAQYTDWFTIFPPMPEAGFTYVVTPSIVTSRCWTPGG